MLHTQIDGLFTAVEQRAAARADAAAAGSPPPRAAVDDGMGFKIAVIGDSTIRVRMYSTMNLVEYIPGFGDMLFV